eukprot:CAMPEP_0194519930 /NCGR_PEP_ID=MMETSP0253-20130528/53734_1 /TAXON_ID=2966 /ORGANISM="Noctiluca scintillans" /LENGTH=131 /DNA_ID=CAMNT_0039364113 /DNA_START=1 /DNA_END=396 /DNA_ORIENTATION=+
MLQNMWTLAQAVLDDQLTDDELLLFDLVDVVHDLFLFHAEVAEMRPFDKSHQRKLLCLIACQKYAVTCCARNKTKVVDVWTKLSVREKHDLRKVVRLTSLKERNTALLELVGDEVTKSAHRRLERNTGVSL